MLFRRLAVFAGGFTLDAAEAVTEAAAEVGVDLLVGILSLVEASLLARSEAPGGAPRYRMLETVREFGLEQLAASGEADGVMGRLAAWALALAAPGYEQIFGPAPRGWLERLRDGARQPASGPELGARARGCDNGAGPLRRTGLVLVCPWASERRAHLG